MVFDILGIAAAAQTAAARTGWEGWPFGGSAGPWLAGAARLAFVALVFVGLAWLLRLLFGPGGPLRPKEFGTEHVEERRRAKREARELRGRWKAGEISDREYEEALERTRNGD